MKLHRVPVWQRMGVASSKRVGSQSWRESSTDGIDRPAQETSDIHNHHRLVSTYLMSIRTGLRLHPVTRYLFLPAVSTGFTTARSFPYRKMTRDRGVVTLFEAWGLLPLFAASSSPFSVLLKDIFARVECVMSTSRAPNRDWCRIGLPPCDCQYFLDITFLSHQQAFPMSSLRQCALVESCDRTISHHLVASAAAVMTPALL